ncbi:MAG: phenylphosphate carboxylase subunit delta [Promethearchaeota archaeon]
MSEDGSLQKGFFSRDFHGMWMLNESGVKIGIISYSHDKTIHRQCERAAKYALVMAGCKDKRTTVEEAFVNRGLTWSEIAYIGDDVIDSTLLGTVGVAACPQDAHDKVKSLIETLPNGLISRFPGGYGAVREFAEYIQGINGDIKSGR